MAMGKPILMAVAGDAAELVQKAQCGCIAISEDAASIQQAILEIYQLPASEQQKMGINARNFYIQELSLESGVKQFVSIFEKVKHD
jgi:colanic acid biosynthesis glycosyl transferase WcaI